MANPSENHLFLMFFIVVLFWPSMADDRQVLLKFKSFLSNASALDIWEKEPDADICRWKGVVCKNNKTAFHGLQLEGMGLTGTIDIATLLELSNLQTFSVKNNGFDGPMPDFRSLGRLKGLYLSGNKFSGEIHDDAFKGIKYLSKVHLAENGFTGKIPTSLAELRRLLDLDIRGNRFVGSIPQFQGKDFTRFDVSNNQLEGPIPESLSNIQNATWFAGNKGLCGKPLSSPCPGPQNHKRPILKIALVIVAVIAFSAIIAALFIFVRRRRKSEPDLGQEVIAQDKGGLKEAQGGPSEAQSITLSDDFKAGESTDLTFLKKNTQKFELHDLLRAPAEVLGSGSFGSSYKAILSNGPAVVVKRFKHMNNVGKEEFFEHMHRLGRLTHPNLLPLVAFYYRKEEKLLVYDFAQNGSLASHLHGRNGERLNWATRLKIIKGVARGLTYLYKEFPGQNLPHGHLKSSNVLLNRSFEPLLAEYGLVPVMNKKHAHQFMASYKAPEVNQFDRPNEKTDVWCLGILILELLTGRFPANYLGHGRGSSNADLATWVNSVVREEWTGEVFDKDILAARNGEGEMLKLLKIGICCCEWGVESRWDWREAVAKIEELKEKDSEDEYSSISEGELYSRTMTEDDGSFATTN